MEKNTQREESKKKMQNIRIARMSSSQVGRSRCLLLCAMLLQADIKLIKFHHLRHIFYFFCFFLVAPRCVFHFIQYNFVFILLYYCMQSLESLESTALRLWCTHIRNTLTIYTWMAGWRWGITIKFECTKNDLRNRKKNCESWRRTRIGWKLMACQNVISFKRRKTYERLSEIDM